MNESKFEPNHFGIIMESLGDGEMNILIGHELDDLSDEERNNCLDLLMGLRLMRSNEAMKWSVCLAA